MTTQIYHCSGQCVVNIKNNSLQWVLKSLCFAYACSVVTTPQSDGLDCADDSTTGQDVFVKLPSTQH